LPDKTGKLKSYLKNRFLQYKKEMDGEAKFMSTAKAAKYLGVSRDTIIRWEEEGVIKCFRTKPGITGHKRFDINSFKGFEFASKPHVKPEEKKDADSKEEKGVCYCRVSTRTQADDLTRQIESMQERFPTFKIIKDFGSGLNFKRKGLCELLRGAIEGDFTTVVVSHRDRLTRFGFELFEWIFDYYRVKLVVLDSNVGSKESELCKDLLSVIHVFSCRANGARRYKKRKEAEEKEESSDQVCEDV
jgi:excisionase family DNA binding protein